VVVKKTIKKRKKKVKKKVKLLKRKKLTLTKVFNKEKAAAVVKVCVADYDKKSIASE
jgi:hypothetical protein